ncbi:MAG: hypothetical protein ACI9ES_001087 [Oceanospirillaceae bacterium]|jgi:hypothetical protein
MMNAKDNKLLIINNKNKKSKIKGEIISQNMPIEDSNEPFIAYR